MMDSEIMTSRERERKRDPSAMSRPATRRGCRQTPQARTAIPGPARARDPIYIYAPRSISGTRSSRQQKVDQAIFAQV